MNRITKLVFALTLTSLFSFKTIAQETWDLRRCIDYAIENSIQLKQAQLGVRNAEINKRLAVESRFPSLNFSTNVGGNFGRTIDPTTNTFVATNLLSNSVALSSGFQIYNGNRINNTVAQAKTDILAAIQDKEQSVNDIALSVAQAYLNLLLAYENVEIAKTNLEQSKEQENQTQKMVNAGSIVLAELLEIQTQVARNEQELTRSENAVIMGMLQLKQLMFLDYDYDLQIEKVNIEPDESGLVTSSSELFSNALQTQPQIQAGKYRLESALREEQIIRAGYFPSLGMFFQLNSFFSSLARGIDGFTVVRSQPTPVILDGEPRFIEFFQEVPVFTDKPYFTQINENLGIGLGVQLTVPIYSNGNTRLNVQRAKINQYNVELENDRIKMQLKNDVELALTDARAARKEYLAAQRTLESSQRVMNDSEKRFNAGVINSFEYTTARTRFESARIGELIAKYDYVFRLKVLDFYMGRPLFL